MPQIEVTFDIDANGILNVSAKDKGTGKEQNIRIEASSGLTEQEIQRMRDEAKANEARDREEREKVDKVNAADTLIFSTEKQLKEYGDKIPADKKANIESALAELKAAHAAGNVANIDSGYHAAERRMAGGFPGYVFSPAAGRRCTTGCTGCRNAARYTEQCGWQPERRRRDRCGIRRGQIRRTIRPAVCGR